MAKSWVLYSHFKLIAVSHGKYWKEFRKISDYHLFETGRLLKKSEVIDILEKNKYVEFLWFELKNIHLDKTDGLDFAYFKERVTSDRLHRTSWYGSIDMTGGSYRNGPKYRKNTEHLQKEEDPKEAWREETNHYRDKARRQKHSNGMKRFWVKQQAKDHRAWAKCMIRKEKWEAFGQNDEEYCINRWLWD
jgi:hypothetical protein